MMMMMNDIKLPAATEYIVLMEILEKCKKNPKGIFVQDVCKSLEYKWKSSTIHTLIKRLEYKKLVKIEIDGRNHKVIPLVTKDCLQESVLRDFKNKFFSNVSNEEFREILSRI